jgi:hypothetical protein
MRPKRIISEISSNNFEINKEQFDMRIVHQPFIQENVFEELVKVYMRPKRIIKLLELGFSAEELDEVM